MKTEVLKRMLRDFDNLQFRIWTICAQILGHLAPVVPEKLAIEKRYRRVGSPTKSSTMFVNIELSPLRADRNNITKQTQ